MRAARVSALATAVLALAAMLAALAGGAGADAEAARVAAARQQAIDLAQVPGMRTSYLGSTVAERLTAAREARERAAAQQRAADSMVPRRLAWWRLQTSLFPHERDNPVGAGTHVPPPYQGGAGAG